MEVSYIVIVFLTILGGAAITIAVTALREERKNNEAELDVFGKFLQRIAILEQAVDILSERFVSQEEEKGREG